MQATNQVSNFLFNQASIRVVTIDGNPWFVSVEIVDALELSRHNGNYHINTNLDETERTSMVLPTSGGPQSMRLVSESGMYKLVMKAKRKNPAVARFQDWVTQVVLPTLRKDSGYIMGEEKVVTGEMSEDELILKTFTILKTKVDRLTTERDALAVSNAIMDKQINFITVDAFRALLGTYQMSQGQRIQLGKVAAKFSRKNNLPMDKQSREVWTPNGYKTTEIGVYTREALEFAAQLVL